MNREPPPAKRTYTKKFLRCTTCNRLDLDKAEHHPQGTDSPCLRCGRTGTLVEETHDIHFAPFKLCAKCFPLRLVVLFTRQAKSSNDASSNCPNCAGPLDDDSRIRNLPIVFRFESHGIQAYQVIPQKGETLIV